MSAGASLRPSDAATGGFLDATIAVVKSLRFIDAYPNGTPSLLLEVTYQPEEGKERTELYRGGGIDQMKPKADGSGYLPEEARMRKDSGAMLLIASFIDGGFDVSKLGADIRVFAGTKVFLRRKALPKFKLKDGTDSKDRDILLVEKVLEMPGEQKKSATKTTKTPVAAKTAAKAAPVAPVAETAAADVPDVATELEAIVTALLAAAPDNTIARNRIGNQTFQAVIKSKNPRRAPLMALVAKDEFLAGETRPWAFDGENIVGVPAEEAAA